MPSLNFYQADPAGQAALPAASNRCTAALPWIAKPNPNAFEEGRLTAPVTRILTRVAAESMDKGARIYTQAEMVRAIELAGGAS